MRTHVTPPMQSVRGRSDALACNIRLLTRERIECTLGSARVSPLNNSVTRPVLGNGPVLPYHQRSVEHRRHGIDYGEQVIPAIQQLVHFFA